MHTPGIDLWERARSRLQGWDIASLTSLLPALSFEADRRLPPEAILSTQEAEAFERVLRESHAWLPVSDGRERLVVILKLTRLCNLRCTYCHAWRDGPGQVMDFETVARAVATTLRKYNVKDIDFVWHGGEVTTLRVEFARKVLWLQAQFARDGQVVRNSIQTNAYRISEEWMTLLIRSGFSVGVSIDGSAEIHDRGRRTVGGRPTFEAVLQNISRMRERGIPTGALLVVTPQVLKLGADGLLQALVQADVKQVALLNEIPEINIKSPAPWNNFVPFSAFVDFLRELLPIWWSSYRNRIQIRELDAYLAALQGHGPRTCTIAGNCMGGYLTIDPDGTISACDKYVGGRDYIFGKLGSAIHPELFESDNLRLARQEADAYTRLMPDCPYYSACRGGCPHDNKLTRTLNRSTSVCCGLRPLFEDLQSLT